MCVKKMLAGQLLALALAFPPAVLAEDFTFAVKVDIRSLFPEITQIKIQCIVSPDDRFFTEFLIGSGAKTVKVPASGSINQKVTVKFNANPGKNPGDATNVGCSLALIDQKGVESSPLRSTDSDCNKIGNLGRCQKPGTQFTKFIRDPLP